MLSVRFPGCFRLVVLSTAAATAAHRLPTRCTRATAEPAESSATETKSKSKIARLSASRKETIKLPNNVDGHAHQHASSALSVGDFFSHPSGIEAILNTRSLQSFEPLQDPPDTYRCKLPQVKFLRFEVAPVLDLRVIPTPNDCTVEMLSCRFEGSKAVERQKLFTAFMRNHITWDVDDSEVYMYFDVNLNVTLEISSKPFSLLPVSAVEKPGNAVIQGLVDRLMPLLVDQILQEYNKWKQEQLHLHLQTSSSSLSRDPS